jgi:outer membrane protein assembly factor BamB
MKPIKVLMFSYKARSMVAGAVLSLATISLTAEDVANWPHWRGPRDNGSITRGSYPVRWDATNVSWEVALPGKGCSTPIVWEKRIFLTAPTNDLDAVLAFDWAGKLLWQTAFGHEQAGRHRNGSGSNPSPAADSNGVFVYFKSGTLAALELDRKVLWQTNLIEGFGPETLYWDQGTSPVLTESDVVIARMHHGESWLAAFNKKSGKLHWKTARNFETPVEGDNAYTTPILIQHRGKEALLVWGGQHLTAHDTADGTLLWSSGGFNPESKPNWPAVASPVVAGETAVVACGRADRGQPLLYGIKLGGSGDVTETHRLWKREDTGTFVPTPAECQGRVYLLRDRGEIECLDPATGKTIWHEAFPKASSSYYASPLVAAGKLYAAREDGKVFVAKVEGAFELLAENNMGERVLASPVPMSNRILIRGEHHLFCVGSD